MAAILVLAFGTNAAMAMAANDPSSLREGQPAPAVATPAQDTQTTPATASTPQNNPPAPIGPHYHDGRYYPGWGCGYYHPVSGGTYYGWGCCW